MADERVTSLDFRAIMPVGDTDKIAVPKTVEKITWVDDKEKTETVVIDGKSVEVPVKVQVVEIVDNPEPETPYCGYLIWLTLAPNMSAIESGKMDFVLCWTSQPYRVLKDGTIDVAPDSYRRNRANGSLSETPALSDICLKLFDTITDLVASEK